MSDDDPVTVIEIEQQPHSQSLPLPPSAFLSPPLADARHAAAQTAHAAEEVEVAKGLQEQAAFDPAALPPAVSPAARDAGTSPASAVPANSASSELLAKSTAGESLHQTNVDLPHRQVLVIYGCLMCCVLLVGLDASIVGTAGPTIVRDLSDYALFPWIVSAYLLASAAVVPIYGKVSDITGRHACFQFALGCFSLGSLLCALSTSMAMLIISRAVQGLGGAGVTIMTQASAARVVVIGDMLAPAERGRYQGLLSVVIAASAIAGPLVAGLFTQYWSWRGIFYLNLPFCGIASLALFRFLKVSIRERRVESVRDIDCVGSLVIMAATVALVMPLVWGGQTYAWSSGVIIGLFVTSAVLCTVFAIVERRWGFKALIPLHMFAVRNFSLCVLVRFLSGCLLYSLVSYLPSYWQTVHNESPTISGLRTVPILGTVTIGSICAGQAISRAPHWKPVPVVGVGLQVLGAGLLTLIGVSTPYVQLAFFMAFLGVGYGLTGPSSSIVVQSSVPLADLAAATAAGTFMSQLGGSVGVAVAGAVFNNLYGQRILSGYEGAGLGEPPDGAASWSGEDIWALSEQEVAIFQGSYVHALSATFYVVLAFALGQMLCTWALQDVPLRGKHTAPAVTQRDEVPPPVPAVQGEATSEQVG